MKAGVKDERSRKEGQGRKIKRGRSRKEGKGSKLAVVRAVAIMVVGGGR